jgi:hypothetical protein
VLIAVVVEGPDEEEEDNSMIFFTFGNLRIIFVLAR